MAALESQEKTDFEYRFVLPESVSLKVEDGQQVERGQLLATADDSTCHHVELTDVFSLGFGPEIISQLTVKIGQQVSKDEVLVEKTKGISKKELLAPITGRVVGFTETGVLKIESGRRQEVKTPFDGRIKIKDNNLSLVFPAEIIKGEWGEGNEFTGQLVYVEPNREDVFCVKANVLNSIVICSQPLTKAALFKMNSLGAGGIVVVGPVKKISELFEEVRPQLGADFGVLIIDPEDRTRLEFLRSTNERQALVRPAQKELVVAIDK